MSCQRVWNHDKDDDEDDEDLTTTTCSALACCIALTAWSTAAGKVRCSTAPSFAMFGTTDQQNGKDGVSV
eukprot:3511097-Rhodomonas_salina.1